MKIVFLLTGKTADQPIVNIMGEYADRIEHFVNFDILETRDLKGKMPPEERCKKEGEELTRQLRDGDFLVLLDDKGKQYNSREFALNLQKWMNAAPKRIVFCVGGAYGFSKEIRDRAQISLSLSKMTFPHQLIRAVFTEQLYRALSILHGSSYHHE